MKLLKALILTGISSVCFAGGFSGTTGGGGGGGYNVQPASVTFQLNQGVTATTATVSSLTSGQVVYPTTGGLLTGSSGFMTDGSNLNLSGQVGAANFSSTATLTNSNIFSSNYSNKTTAPPVLTVLGSYDTGDLAIEHSFFRIDNRNAHAGIPLDIFSFANLGIDKAYIFWDASYDGGGGTGCLYATPQISPSVSGWMSCFGTVGSATTPVYTSFGKNITPTRKDGVVQIIPNSGTEVGAVIYENAQSTSTDMFQLKDSSDTNTLGRFDGGANGYFNSMTLTGGITDSSSTAQSYTANGSGAGEFVATEATFTAVAPASGVDILYADAVSHAFIFNPNNTSTFSVVGSSLATVAGHLAIWSNQFGLVDGGIPFASASLLASTNTWTATQIFKSSIGVVTSNLTVSISTNGYIGYSGGSAPTFSGCGTTPTVTAGSDNMRGSVTMTSGLSSACTIIPATPSPQNYFCVISGGGSGTGVFFQQSANLTGSCDNATGLVSCGVGTFMTWNCTGTN